MNHYKVIYSYAVNGHYYRRTDFVYANSANDAARECRLCYETNSRKNFRIEAVFIERTASWDFIDWSEV